MPKRRKNFDLSDNCRVCLSKNDCMADLYLPEIFSKIKEVANSATIQISDVSNEGLPKNICHICLHKLEEWCEFRSQFIKTNKTLVDYLDGVSDFSDHISGVKRKIDNNHQLSEDISKESNQEVKKLKVDFAIPTLEPITKVNDKNCVKDMEKSPKQSKSDFKMDFDSTSGSQMILSVSPTTTTTTTTTRVTRQLLPRKTNEQRLASTQRHEARKKALLAATGETVSDSDSIGSDETQLSPIQKARAKNNAQKDVDYQKNLTNVMNNLGKTEVEKLTSSLIDTTTSPKKNNKTPCDLNNENFKENIVQSELVIGDETYMVTTTLSMTDSPIINKIMANDVPVLIETKSQDNEQQTSEENCEIFDAVQLRRVKPNDKYSTKNCLNLEVAANDTESLNRLQNVLATFIEVDMKQKINTNSFMNTTKTILKPPKDSYQILENKLKNLIEESVKKNIDTNQLNNKVDLLKINKRGNNTFPLDFVKAAEKSLLFQPKVLLNRIEPIPNFDKEKIIDNKTTIKGVSSEVENIEINYQVTPVPILPPTINQTIQDTSTISLNSDTNNISINNVSMMSINDITMHGESSEEVSRHVCGDCGAVFSTKKEVEQHFVDHNNQQKKPKVKRCKRCKVVVDAELVKTHVCRNKLIHNCLTCNSIFKTDKMLEKHMKTHKDQVLISRVNNISIENIDKLDETFKLTDDYCKNDIRFSCYVCDKIFVNEVIMNNHLQEHYKDQQVNPTDEQQIVGVAVVLPEDVSSIKKQHGNITPMDRHEVMTTEKLQELLSENIDEISADISAKKAEKTNQLSLDNSKGEFLNNLQIKPDQKTNDNTVLCGMCSFRMPITEIDKHIDEHIRQENAHDESNSPGKNHKKEHSVIKSNNILLYDCVQCQDKFESEEKLAVHMQTHEEGTTYDEFEDNEIKSQNKHHCTICNSSFDNEKTLAEHIDVHNESSTVCGICHEKLPSLKEFESHVAGHFT